MSPAAYLVVRSALLVASLCAVFRYLRPRGPPTTFGPDCYVDPTSTLLSSEELRYIRYGEGEAAVADDEQRYLNYIRSFVTRPSDNLPRRLDNDPDRKHFSQVGQSEFIDKRLAQRRDGFFVECGAVDGEQSSNSLFFELQRNWTGLLIEANPAFHETLLAKNRRAYVLGGCLSPTRRPAALTFRPAGVFGGLGDSMEKTHADVIAAMLPGGDVRSAISVQCFPLMDILRALGVTHIDYLSLDVEGPEVEILETVDWSRLRIDVLSVEYRIVTSSSSGSDVVQDRAASALKFDRLRRLINDTGLYRLVATLKALDIIFERKDLGAN